MRSAAGLSEHIMCSHKQACLEHDKSFITCEWNAHDHEHEVTDGQIYNQDVGRRPHQRIESNN
jgi:hypothetical protein